MFLGMEANMKLFVYTNTFVHEGEKLMSAGIGVREGEIDCKAIIGLPFYMHRDRLFEGAMALMSMAGSTETLLENLGHTVEIEEVLKSSLTLNDYLTEEFSK